MTALGLGCQVNNTNTSDRQRAELLRSESFAIHTIHRRIRKRHERGCRRHGSPCVGGNVRIRIVEREHESVVDVRIVRERRGVIRVENKINAYHFYRRRVRRRDCWDSWKWKRYGLVVELLDCRRACPAHGRIFQQKVAFYVFRSLGNCHSRRRASS